MIIEPGRKEEDDGLSRLTNDRFDARNACDRGVKAFVDLLTIDTFCGFDVLFQIARLDVQVCDERDLLVLIPQWRGERLRAAGRSMEQKVGSCWRAIVATWRLIVF